MSIITFWGEGREQNGQTLSAVAVATNMAIERNSKILLLSTSFDDSTIKNCFWENSVAKKTNPVVTKNSNVATENGIEGLAKLITSNKLEPSIITDYTKVVFKNRLEIIDGFTANSADLTTNIQQYKKIQECYVDLIKCANRYYDIVIVDLDKMLSKQTREAIIEMSNVNIYVFSQKLSSINRYIELKKTNEGFFKKANIPVIGRYDKRYKYNSKNIARYLSEKKEFNRVPQNLLYMEAAEEIKVADLLLKLKNVKDKTDENYVFMECIQDLTNNILNKLQEMKMRLR